MKSGSYLYGYKVTIDRLKGVMLQHARSPLRSRISVAVHGGPGLGKTEMCGQVASELGIRFLRYGMPQVDYLQLGGMPVLLKKPVGDKMVARYPILEIPSRGNGIILLDDWTHVPREVQNVGLDLAKERRLNDARLGDGWLVVICANISNVVYPMDSPVSNRFMHFHLMASYVAWRPWAILNGIRTEIIGYLDSNTGMLNQEDAGGALAFRTPRSWTYLSQKLDDVYGTGKLEPGPKPQESAVMLYTAAIVGMPAATDFLSYLTIYKVINLSEVVKGTLPNFDELSKGDPTHRQVLECALSAQCRRWWTSSERKTKGADRVRVLARVLGYLTNPFRFQLVRDMTLTHGREMAKLATSAMPSKEEATVKEILRELAVVQTGMEVTG